MRSQEASAQAVRRGCYTEQATATDIEGNLASKTKKPRTKDHEPSGREKRESDGRSGAMVEIDLGA